MNDRILKIGIQNSTLSTTLDPAKNKAKGVSSSQLVTKIARTINYEFISMLVIKNINYNSKFNKVSELRDYMIVLNKRNSNNMKDDFLQAEEKKVKIQFRKNLKGQEVKFFCLRAFCIAFISDVPIEIDSNNNSGNTLDALRKFVDYVNNEKLFERNNKENKEEYISDYRLTDEKTAVNKRGKKVYRTNPIKLLGEKILGEYDYKCSCHTEEHLYFTSNVTKKNYLEFHHLIPFSNQEFYLTNFNIDLDVAENLIPLCPHCHMLLHHSVAKEKAIVLQFLYNKHIDELRKVDSDINLFRLMEFYNVFLIS